MMAERNKRAQILEAEGLKQAQMLEAEGRKEAAFRDAEARERSAEAEARATQVVSEAIAKGDVQAINYFVAQKYTEALGKIGSATNSKIVLMPIEASSLIGSLGGIGAIAKEVFGERRHDRRAAPARRARRSYADATTEIIRGSIPCSTDRCPNSAPGTGWCWAWSCWRWKSWCRASSCSGSASPRSSSARCRCCSGMRRSGPGRSRSSSFWCCRWSRPMSASSSSAVATTRRDQPLLNRRGEQLVGRTATLTEPIHEGRGRIQLGDTLWRVAGPDLPVGARVRVVAVADADLELMVEARLIRRRRSAADRGNARRRPAGGPRHDQQRRDIVVVEQRDAPCRKRLRPDRLRAAGHDVVDDRASARLRCQIAARCRRR